jgi:hypothetical protein
MSTDISAECIICVLKVEKQSSKKLACNMLLSIILCSADFYPENGGDTFFRNVCSHTDYTAVYFKSWVHSNYTKKFRNKPWKQTNACSWVHGFRLILYKTLRPCRIRQGYDHGTVKSFLRNKFVKLSHETEYTSTNMVLSFRACLTHTSQ